MMTPTEAAEVATRLAYLASSDDPDDWRAAAQTIEQLEGRAWLLVDQAARKSSGARGMPVSGVRGWLGTSVTEPSGVVAAVTSMHADGRFRERATQVLGAVDTRTATAALAVRLLDHVPHVRAQAWEGLERRLTADTAEIVLEVLLAGRGRQHADRALERVHSVLLQTTSAAELLTRLLDSDRRGVRRWAFTLGHARQLLDPEHLVAAARSDPDQWVRTRCADWLMASPEPHLLAPLLEATTVEARLVALTRVPDPDLTVRTLGRLLTDRAPRVRDQARWRARRRGFDSASHYRAQLEDPRCAPRVRAACLDGLAVAGDEADLVILTSHLDHPSARVRAAAVKAVTRRAPSDDLVDLLLPVLLDASARVSATAAGGLARWGVPPSAARSAWASARPASRRAAWRLSREAGGWDRVEADLRAASDEDVHLASLGRAGIGTWLAVTAATTWVPLAEDQRERIACLLPRAGLGSERQRVLAFHAGIKPLTPEDDRPRSDDTTPDGSRRRRWLGLVRNR